MDKILLVISYIAITRHSLLFFIEREYVKTTFGLAMIVFFAPVFFISSGIIKLMETELY